MIFVFKTSVKTKMQVQQLQPHIDTIVPIAAWNFDLQDCDKILRIDSMAISLSASAAEDRSDHDFAPAAKRVLTIGAFLGAAHSKRSVGNGGSGARGAGLA